MVESLGQGRFVVAWNLASLESPWGQKVLYRYQQDEQPVGNGLRYTRACYLSGITDSYGRRIEMTLRGASAWRVVALRSRPVAAAERPLAERLLAGPRAGEPLRPG